jgi:protein-tyrosine kinase
MNSHSWIEQGPLKAQDRSIGEIIQTAFNLSNEQVEQVIRYQQEHQSRFGESAVALGFIKANDVVWALSQQFEYPYSTGAGQNYSNELVMAFNPFSEGAEVFRNLRSDILGTVFAPGSPKRSLAIVSPEKGDGKSFFAANIAIAFSQLGGRTLLVDADMRAPRQHRLFGVKEPHGLSSVLSGRMSEPVFSLPLEWLPNLYVLPVGITPPNPPELLQRGGLAMLLAELQLKFDFVIVDTPAASYGADAKVIASKCGSSLIVANKNRTQMKALEGFADGLRRSGASVMGVILNNC